LEEELVGDLEEKSRAVSGGSVSPDGSAVYQVVQDDQGLGDDSVGPRLVEIGHESDTATVVLEGGVIETFGFQGR
jgi:hypothetical protein